MRGPSGDQRLLLSLAGRDRLQRLLVRLFDESEFLSPHGLRALSAYHREHPYVLSVEGVTASIDYEPAESTTPMFGGNSNWRGPVWFPLNYLVISVLERYTRTSAISSPVSPDRVGQPGDPRQGRRRPAGPAHRDLHPGGRRPAAVLRGDELLQSDPAWRDNLVFGEYFHGDNAAALGASHQTGWTGLIADIVRRRYGMVRSIGDAILLVGQQNPA